MEKPVNQMDRHVESVLAALDVMDSFLEYPKQSIKEIVAVTGMTRNRVTRIVGTLVHRGYLMQAIDGAMYTPGPRLLALGNVFEANQNLVALVKSALRQLALTTGESATFYVREGQERVVLARVEGANAIRFSVAVGQRMDLFTGAAGKVLLAYVPEIEKKIMLTNRQLDPLTPETITNPQALVRELDTIRQIGYAVSRGERDSDAFSLAAPVFESRRQLIGAVAIAGPISRFAPAFESSHVVELLKSARLLSEQFGLKGDGQGGVNQ